MIGIRPNTARKIKWKGNGNSSNTIRPSHLNSGKSPVFKVSLGSIRRVNDKYGDTWEGKNGKYPTRVKKKRGAVRTITAPRGPNSREELIDFLDYGDICKIVFEMPGIFDRGDIKMEPSGDHIRITAPGFTKEIPAAGQSLESWNYANGVLEINMRK